MAVRRVDWTVPELTWVQRSLLVGAVITLLWSNWRAVGLDERILRDGLLYVVGPVALAGYYGRDIGLSVDRTAVRNTLLLALFVLPFYLVGSSLPTIRAYYPMWPTSLAPAEFVPHATKQLLVVIAAETYYRGLLCVGVREIGFKSVFISPVVYAIHHLGKPPIELVLSGPTDVLFGAVDYKSTSILPSIVAHGVGLVFLDVLVLLDEPVIPTATVVDWLSWLPLPI